MALLEQCAYRTGTRDKALVQPSHSLQLCFCVRVAEHVWLVCVCASVLLGVWHEHEHTTASGRACGGVQHSENITG